VKTTETADAARYCWSYEENDGVDAAKIADCLRCDFLPERRIAPTEIRGRRPILRYRNLVQRQADEKPVFRAFDGNRCDL
jgi:hypothetical protein